jgi:hypothetical protein
MTIFHVVANMIFHSSMSYQLIHKKLPNFLIISTHRSHAKLAQTIRSLMIKIQILLLTQQLLTSLFNYKTQMTTSSAFTHAIQSYHLIMDLVSACLTRVFSPSNASMRNREDSLKISNSRLMTVKKLLSIHRVDLLMDRMSMIPQLSIH